MSAAMREAFGGRWDGGGREVHGLIEWHGRALKIELLRASAWRCSIFEGGACVSTATHEDMVGAARSALAALEPEA